MSSRLISIGFCCLLGALAAGAVALAPLPRTAWALLLAAVAAGALWDRTGRPRLPARVLTLFGAVGFLVSLLPPNRETLAEQSLTALGVLLAVKFLGGQSRRDHLQILAMSLLLVAGAASLEPGLLAGVLLGAALLIGVFFLLWLPFSDAIDTPDPGLLRRLGAIGLALSAACVPTALLLFLLLPRSINPYWSGFGGRRAVGVSGASDRLQLGDVGRIALSGDVAFRAELEGGRPLAATPYWRGAVLEVTDGRRWEVSGRTRPPQVLPAGPQTRIVYYVEPHGERQLFVLETPVSATLSSRTQSLGAARVLRLGLPLARRIRYTAASVPGRSYAEGLLPEERALNLRLPPTLSPRIVDLARRIAGPAPDPATAAQRLVAHFSSGYTYSLSVPDVSGDPLEAFLLGNRTGYCEYFASGLALMLRAVGVPARVVGGYLGGEYVPAGSYYLVTQAAAHAWVEAWYDGRWVRLDPTPAAGELGTTFAARSSRRPLLWLDALRMRWNSWVVQYDAESQYALARAGAARVRDWRLDRRRLARAAGGALALGAALVALRFALHAPRLRGLASRLQRFERIAARAGAAREPSEGPLDHAARVASRLPAAAAEASRFGALAAACRYGGRSADPALLAEIDALLAALSAAARSERRAIPAPPP